MLQVCEQREALQASAQHETTVGDIITALDLCVASLADSLHSCRRSAALSSGARLCASGAIAALATDCGTLVADRREERTQRAGAPAEQPLGAADVVREEHGQDQDHGGVEGVVEDLSEMVEGVMAPKMGSSGVMSFEDLEEPGGAWGRAVEVEEESATVGGGEERERGLVSGQALQDGLQVGVPGRTLRQVARGEGAEPCRQRGRRGSGSRRCEIEELEAALSEERASAEKLVLLLEAKNGDLEAKDGELAAMRALLRDHARIWAREEPWAKQGSEGSVAWGGREEENQNLVEYMVRKRRLVVCCQVLSRWSGLASSVSQRRLAEGIQVAACARVCNANVP